MKLVVFDIDGTLTDTNQVDGDAFLSTFSSLHGVEDLSTDWGSYLHSTDSGIVDEVFKKRMGRPPKVEEISRFVEFFVNELQKSSDQDPSLFREISGASQVITMLPSAGWTLALATGAWKESALFKLRHGNIPFEEIPAAFAEDAFDRADIIKAAIERAKGRTAQSEFKKVVYVGDGSWDRTAASKLQIGFVHRSERPTGPGLSHYRNPDELFRLLELA